MKKKIVACIFASLFCVSVLPQTVFAGTPEIVIDGKVVQESEDTTNATAQKVLDAQIGNYIEHIFPAMEVRVPDPDHIIKPGPYWYFGLTLHSLSPKVFSSQSSNFPGSSPSSSS